MYFFRPDMNPIVSNGNKLKWKFENVDKLTYDGMYSDKFTFKHMNWEIRIWKNDEDFAFRLFYLDNMDRTEKNWICEMKSVCKVLNQIENGKDLTKNDVGVYTSDNLGTSLELFKLSKLETREYMKDNSIIVEIELDFKYYDFSNYVPTYTDIIFNVQGTKLYVNKELLCSKSEYFYNKFIVDNSDEKELTIKNVKIEYFRYFIASFWFFSGIVRMLNYKELMEFAAEYKTPHLHRTCEIFLISNKLISSVDKIKLAAKYDYDEALKTSIDSLTTAYEIDELHEWEELKNLKLSTKLAIGKKTVDILKELEKQELRCRSCTKMNAEENLHICQTCNDQNLNNFKIEEELLKIVICANCAIKKHIRQGHVTVDFLPHYLVCRFKNQSEEVETILKSFQQVENVRKDEEQKWKTMNETADMKFNGLVDLTRRSKSTKCLQENMDDVKGFIKTAKDANDRLIEVMKTEELLMQKNLQKMEKWIEEKSKECVEDEKFIKLEL